MAVALLLTGLPLAAQEVVRAQSAPQMAGTVSLDFKGGSLAQFLQMVRNAGGANVIASPLAERVELPAILLRQAEISSALFAVQNVAPPTFRLIVDVKRTPPGVEGFPVYTVQVIEAQGRNTATNLVTAQVGPRNAAPMRVSVFSLRNLVRALPGYPEGEGMTVPLETVLGAIEIGLSVGGKEEEKADIRYHEDSGLLFVRGDRNQLGMVENVIGRLESDLRDVRKAAQNEQRARERSGRQRAPDKSDKDDD